MNFYRGLAFGISLGILLWALIILGADLTLRALL